MNQTKEHWNDIYAYLEPEEVGWYEKIPESTIKMLSKCHIDKNDTILDVGGGESTFVDYLVEQGYKNIIITDISEKALNVSKLRLGNNASLVKWIVDDITQPKYLQKLKDIAVWHDRAFLHFLVDESDQIKYLSLLNKILRGNGYVIIATFSLNCVKKCAGLDVKNYDQTMLAKFLGNDYNLIEYFDYIQYTPVGEPRPYVYTLFQKKKFD